MFDITAKAPPIGIKISRDTLSKTTFGYFFLNLYKNIGRGDRICNFPETIPLQSKVSQQYISNKVVAETESCSRKRKVTTKVATIVA